MDMRSNSFLLAAARVVSYLPPALYFPLTFRSWARFLDDSEYWSAEQLGNYQIRKLKSILQLCAQRVPFYRLLFQTIGFDPDKFEHISQIQVLPLLDQETVQLQLEDFIAEGTPPRQIRAHSTGGTLGQPMSFRNVRSSVFRDQAFMFHQWKRVGFRSSDLRALLRGRVVKNPRRWEYDPYERGYFFSNFHMSPDNVAEYAKVMKRKKLPFLHSYPSAVVDFARILRDLGISPPKFRAILLSSETVYEGQRELIEEFFQCRSFSWYGHTENLVLGAECEYSTAYHMFPQYSFVEVVKEDGTAAHEGELGEIVGTTLDNTVMPLLRYRTGDWAVVGPDRCRCGRNCLLLKEAVGRHQEMLIGKDNNLVSMTAINMHSNVFDHVRQYQFHQTEPGQVTLRIIRKPAYTDLDSKKVLAELGEKMGDTIKIELVFVEHIPLTQRGKFRFIIQDAKVPAGMGGAQ
jgi:phenylacetate-CoA ligase